MDSGKSVFRRQHERLGQVIAGNDGAVLFRLIEKRNGAFGVGGVIQIKNTNNGRISHRHIIADGQIHTITPSHKNSLPPIWKDFPQYSSKFPNNLSLHAPHGHGMNAAILFHQIVVIYSHLPI